MCCIVEFLPVACCSVWDSPVARGSWIVCGKTGVGGAGVRVVNPGGKLMLLLSGEGPLVVAMVVSSMFESSAVLLWDRSLGTSSSGGETPFEPGYCRC